MSRHVVFRCADQRFGLPLAAAREVVSPARAYTRIPRAPASARGVMNVRGRIVTVIDFARLLGITGMPTDPLLCRVIVLEAKKRDLGLLVDEVVGIQVLERERAAPGGPPMCVGLARLAGDPVTLIGPEPLIASVLAAFSLPAERPS